MGVSFCFYFTMNTSALFVLFALVSFPHSLVSLLLLLASPHSLVSLLLLLASPHSLVSLLPSPHSPLSLFSSTSFSSGSSSAAGVVLPAVGLAAALALF